MALIKPITQPNGIVLNYHRVGTVINITNGASLIEVVSYISKTEREKEAEAIANAEPFNVLVEATTYNTPYDPQMDVTKAYAHIKSLPEYEGAEDD